MGGLCFFHELETGALVAVSLNLLVPHRQGAHPQAAVTVQRTVYYHGFLGFGMLGHIHQKIFLALKMPIFPKLNLQNT